jgi:hypothetical protein
MAREGLRLKTQIAIAGGVASAAVVSLAFGYVYFANSSADTTAQNSVPVVPAALVHAQVQHAPDQALSNTTSLTRALQMELSRVGCYEGPVNGQWTAGSRAAMTAFNDKVNAKLPVSQPDNILLSLVKAHQKVVCGLVEVAAVSPAPPPSPPAAAASDAIATLIARSPERAPGAEKPRTEPAPAAGDIISGSSGDAGAGAVTKLAEVTPLDSKSDDDGSGTISSDVAGDATAAPIAAETQARTGPKVRKHQNRLKPMRAKSRPPKFVRSLIRSVQKSFAGLGF